MSFNRLIRFVDDQGRTSYGDLDEAFSAKEIIGKEVQPLVGTLQYGFTKTNEKRVVKKVSLRLNLTLGEDLLTASSC